MEYIKEHKKMFIVGGLLLVLFIFLFFFCRLFLVDNSKDSYGDRLDGIEKVKINQNTISKIENSLKEKDGVESAKYRLQGRLIYIDIVVGDIEIDKAKEISNVILECLSDKEKAYYDIQVIITSKDKEGYPITGYKHKTSESIVW